MEDISDFDYDEFNKQKKVYLGEDLGDQDGENNFGKDTSFEQDYLDIDFFDEVNRINDEV
jgi:hypothetical protein